MASKNVVKKYHLGATNQTVVTRQLIKNWHMKARAGGRGKIMAKKEAEET